MLKAIKEPMAKAKLSFVQFPTGKGLTTILMHDTGEFISSFMELMPIKEEPQAQGSAITYARRYALSAILGLDTEADDDGNQASTPLESKKCVVCKTSDAYEGYDRCGACYHKSK